MSTIPADAVVGVAKYEREKEKQKKKTNKKTRNYIAKFTTFLAFFAAGADPGGPAPYPRKWHLYISRHRISPRGIEINVIF